MAKQDLHKYVLDMVYKYRWIDQALDDLEQEVGYVICEFGIASARKMEALRQDNKGRNQRNI